MMSATASSEAVSVSMRNVRRIWDKARNQATIFGIHSCDQARWWFFLTRLKKKTKLTLSASFADSRNKGSTFEQHAITRSCFMNRVLEVTAAICLGTLLCSPLLHAQTTGSISGTVTDPAG